MNAEALDLMLGRELPLARSGCTQAYGRIVAACQNTVTAIALAITRDVQASEDIAQETFLKAWQQLARLQNSASFLPWLRQITRNLARDWLRANRRRPLSGEAADLAIGMAADPDPSPAERLLRIEEEQAAAEIIAALPEDSRETLLLYYREGQRSQQVADLLGLTDAAVRKRLSRARASVREELMQRFGRFACGSAPGIAFGQMLAATLSAGGRSSLGTGLEVAAGSVGSGVAAKSLFGGAAGSGALFGLFSLLGGLVSSGVLFWLCAKMLFSYTDTDEERRRVWCAYRRYMIHSLLAVVVAIVVAVFTTGIAALSVTLLLGLLVINYDIAIAMPRLMRPLLARDAARRPEGALSRQLGYRLSFGTSGLIITNACLLVMAPIVLLQRLS